MEFIEILKKEHNEICKIFDEIDAVADLEKKKGILKRLISVVEPHLKKEDEELYPALRKSPDEEVRRMADIFSFTMGEYSSNFKAVTDEIMTTTGEMTAEEKMNYERIRDRIKDRITIEEVTIFPAYENLPR